jgi:hypothetical protein
LFDDEWFRCRFDRFDCLKNDDRLGICWYVVWQCHFPGVEFWIEFKLRSLFRLLGSRSDFMRLLIPAGRVPNVSEQSAGISSLPTLFFGRA